MKQIIIAAISSVKRVSRMLKVRGQRKKRREREREGVNERENTFIRVLGGLVRNKNELFYSWAICFFTSFYNLCALSPAKCRVDYFQLDSVLRVDYPVRSEN